MSINHYNYKHTVRLVWGKSKRTMKTRNMVFSVMILAILAGCAGEGSHNPPADQKIRVTTEKVTSATGAKMLSYSGTVEASQTIPLNFQVAGIVKEVYVDAGEDVKKGKVLARIDDADPRNLYLTMLAKFNQAQDAYDRLKSVHDQGSLPDIKWVEMKTNLEQAKASLDLAKNNLDKCDLVAPVDGTVGRRNIEPGQSSLGLLSAPIELIRIEKVFVRISVPENEINAIKKGNKASISVMAVNGNRFEGEVTNISPVAEVMSRTYTVKISVTNPNRVLKPGMVCDVTLETGKESPVPVISYHAVGKDSDGKNYVFLVNPEGTSVKKQTVTVGRYNCDKIEILSGLKEGDEVVASGMEKLSDNSLIER
jgi:RND family efflux transporter MFP subunit